jgi:uncharacterized protein (TIGR02594 family)
MIVQSVRAIGTSALIIAMGIKMTFWKWLLKLFHMEPTTMEPAWVLVARGQIGVKETGAIPNPEVMKYFEATSYRPTTEEAWCSAFVNWCMLKVGIKGTYSASARSWMQWGKVIDKPVNGCVCIFWRGNPNYLTGHVGFYVGESETEIMVLGGNENNQVCVMGYSKIRLLGYRYPI